MVRTHLARCTPARDGAALRQEVLLRVFRTQSHFDGVTTLRATRIDGVLRQRQRLAQRHAQLPLDQINADHRFRHRMLDLQARVHLHEVERAVRGK